MAKTTALLAKYIGLFEKNPTGLVFAPLAENYRKLNMHKEAMEVLKKGLRHHPHYILGLIVLAHCHFDLGNVEQSYRILSPIVQQEPDNLMLQKLFAQICYKMYAYKEALQSYKNVLYVNPTDEEAKNKIHELEEQEENYYAYMNKATLAAKNEYIEKNAEAKPQSIEDVGAWKSLEHQKDLPQVIIQKEDEKISNYLKEVSVDDAQSWTVKQWSVAEHNENPKPLKLEQAEVESPVEEITSDVTTSNSSINLDSYQNLSPSEEIPIVTHTLIDIFCSQKHYDKALELLNKVLKNDPTDQRSQQKLQQVLSKLQEQKQTGSTKKNPPIPNSKLIPELKPLIQQPQTSWNEAKYNMLSQRYGKLLDGLKDLGKSR